MKAVRGILTVLAVAVAAAGFAQPRSKTRVAFVNVLDRTGAPVLDLTAGDFEVTEGAAKLPVVRAGLAATPMRVALIVDTSDGATPALNHIRTGLLALIDELPPTSEVMLVSTGRQGRVRVQPTTDRKKIKDAAGGLFNDGGATVLIDTLLEIDSRFLLKAPDRWPVFVIVTADSAEGSAGAHEKKFNEWLVAMPHRGIDAHAVALKYKGGGMPEVVASHVAETAGGLYTFMNTSNALPDKLKEIGARIAADFKGMATKYEVEFQTDAPAQSKVDIGVNRPGVTIKLSYGRSFR